MVVVVVEGDGVEVAEFEPGDEDGAVGGVALAGFGVFLVEEVADAVGCGFVYDDGVGDGGDGGGDGGDELAGVGVFGFGVEGYFGEVCHFDVLGADAVGFDGGAYGDAAAALWYLADVEGAFEGEEFVALAVEWWHFGGAEFVHGADVFGGVHGVGADDAVPAFFEAHLDPVHVELGEGGAAPLAGFEEDDADGVAGEAHVFEGGEELALAFVEEEGGLGAG